ncbi:MAG: digeranylgeranylglycerophospholipid reductase [Gemmatimonadetes bacterium]|nr:MAG: digeranylgeranylglycerophospholipid reductase [Gemmatimonadota bacterium]PYO84568.1 MAG: digeranylgeranylglycerophospholipid reductase [Gemmatimonadota bacterium]PYP63492.1 MAG: digeranylgeranylglycerophospholipid reductase [Gemmatimonadota bacterium]
MPDYDVLVVGAGPAGSVAAAEAKRAAPELDVLLIERDPFVGTPVRCAEGVGDPGLREFADPDGAPWASRKITRVIILAPDDTEVKVAWPDVAWILDRTRFDAALAAQAAAEGVAVHVATEAVGMDRTADGRWAMRLRTSGGEETVRARVVIGADGVETMVGRWAGLDTRVPARDMESCAQYVLDGIDFDPDAIYLQFGDHIAPGGYAWLFPKSERSANVGLGIVALKSDGRNAREYLDEWIARRYAGGARTGYTVGGVIVHHTLKRTHTDGVMICGDAAHMVNPLSGGGIVNAMKSGRLAGRAAAAAIRAGDTSEARLASYHQAWMDLLGEAHVKYYRIKQALADLDDAFFNRLARTVNGIPSHKRTLGRVFAHALVRHPQLIPVAARFFV